ncbi:uncharacterized protein DS421_16g550560 [Arachis hypogaea]|nr:uncharacterized protein DS421_16g550560 [Arachis hypogaea]
MLPHGLVTCNGMMTCRSATRGMLTWMVMPRVTMLFCYVSDYVICPYVIHYVVIIYAPNWSLTLYQMTHLSL